MGRIVLRTLVQAFSALVLLAAPGARAGVVADRVAVRYVTPETGGSARPRFITERELGFFARVEAAFEQATLEPNEYPERYVRLAVDRLIARSMLASLVVQRGVEPPDLPRRTLEARSELEERLGGAHVLVELMRSEGIEEGELLSFLRDEVRAEYSIDRSITPIVMVTEDALREAFRSMMHPFRGRKFDEVRDKLRRWLVKERLRSAELEFLQGARARIRVAAVRDTSRGGGVQGGERQEKLR